MAFIFDLDGTLIDSMNVWVNADKNFLGKFGIIPDEEYNKKISSLTFTEGVEYIKSRYNIEMSTNEIMNELYNLAYDEYANNIKLKEHVLEFIKKAKQKNIKMGIATSCIKDMCFAVLKRNNIYEYFDVFMFSDEIGVNKTFPDIYIETAKKLGEDIKKCVIFEDSLHAIEGAKKSGAYVVGVYDEFSKDNKQKIIDICNEYINTFNEFSI